MDKRLIVTIADGVQTIRFNRPEKKNAISLEIYKGVTDALNSAADNNSVKMTVLTGSGDYYSSGNDLSHVSLNETVDMDKFIEEVGLLFEKFICAFIDYPKILVAVVNGPAVGVVVTTLALCDLVIASDKATFCTPFSKLGLSAEGCSTYTFPRIMGPIRSSLLLYFNHKIDANEAKQWGLVSHIVHHKEMDAEVPRILKDYLQYPIKSMIYSKKLLRGWDREMLHEANRAECKQLKERWTSEDFINAFLQFMNKRSKL